MARGWQVLDLTGDACELRYRRGEIQVLREGEVLGRAALADLAVVLLGNSVRLSSGTLGAVVAHDVAVMMCDWRGVPTGGAFSWSETTRVGARQRAHAELSLPRRKNAWGRLIRAKITGQAHTLELLGRPGTARLRELAASVRSGDPENREAQAARIYWARVFDVPAFSRVPVNGEGINALLNYGYSVVRGHGIRAVLGAGLSPTLGVFHRGRGNGFALVDDLIEPFRPAVDYVVAGLAIDAADVTSRESRHALVEAARQGFSGPHRLTTEFDRLAQDFGRYAEGEVDRLTVPIWAGPTGVDDDE